MYQKNNRVQSIMIEVNRRLYMDETDGTKSENLKKVRADLLVVLKRVSAFRRL